MPRGSRAVVAAFALCLPALVAGCGGRGGAVDVPALNDELARVVFFSKNAQGFDYDVSVACTATDALHYTCHVVATTPGRPTNEWDEQVACAPRQEDDRPRCVTASGWALQ